MRFTLIGILLVFTGFLILGIFGRPYFDFTVQQQEFGNCIDYSGGSLTSTNCDNVLLDKIALFAVVSSFICGGIFSLIQGYRGKWDQDVKSDEMVGPNKS